MSEHLSIVLCVLYLLGMATGLMIGWALWRLPKLNGSPR